MGGVGVGRREGRGTSGFVGPLEKEDAAADGVTAAKFLEDHCPWSFYLFFFCKVECGRGMRPAGPRKAGCRRRSPGGWTRRNNRQQNRGGEHPPQALVFCLGTFCHPRRPVTKQHRDGCGATVHLE